jgi:8-oxo-dGTP diphosphatase
VSAPDVRAAGGIVLRSGIDRQVEVLLVHRPGHRDWTLPKGKAEPEETDESCALREVAEETGLTCVLGPEVGGSRYRDRRGRDKAVRYWVMTVREGDFAPNDEVDEIRWLPIREAGRRLSYPGDRTILETLLPALRPLVFLVRHASAGERGRWTGDDRLRPLDARGRRQAEGLAAPLSGYPIVRLVSSGYDRCVQTLEPLSARLALPIEQHSGLAEGASAEAALALIAGLGPGPSVLCTHGDVVEALVDPDEPHKKGAVWLLARQADRTGALRPVRYWPPTA